MIKNRITELLQIKYPIIQGAMCEVSEDPAFVAAVCNAGALGTLAAFTMGAEAVRDAIHQIRELTDQPFAVNTLRESPQYERTLEVMVEEKVPVFCHGRYHPTKAIQAAEQAGTICLPTVGAVKHAVEADQQGAAGVLVTGTEAGGHTGYVTTMVLVPAVARKITIPMVAGGGIATPEQIAALFCLGAEGVIIGTRFMMCKESMLHPRAIKRLLEATEEETYASVHVSGRHQRWLVTPWIREKIMPLPEIKGEDHIYSFAPYAGLGCVVGDVEKGIVGAGQGVGLIDDVRSIAETVEWLMEGCEKVLRETAKIAA